MDKSWKRFERYVARTFNTQRIPVLGKEDADVIAPEGLWIDAKQRQEVPKQYFTYMDAAATLGYDGYTCNGMLITTLQHIKEALDQQEEGSYLALRASLSEKAEQWLRHMYTSAPDNYLPMVVMIRPRMPYRQALVAVSSGHWPDWMAVHFSFPFGPDHEKKGERL